MLLVLISLLPKYDMCVFVWVNGNELVFLLDSGTS